MIDDIMSSVDKVVHVVKKKIYGKTFACPVCHLELSYHDADKDGNLVCPVCGVVIELHSVYGHNIPVINDVEINRVQPKMRIHPVATHLPIGLFPLAMLGAIFLLLMSLYGAFANDSCSAMGYLQGVSNGVLIMFAVSVVSSIITYASGVYDWKLRYGGRPYRMITLKIMFSAFFIIAGAGVVLLHNSVFNEAGIIDFSSAATIAATAVYFVLQGLAMVFMATLGHVGGYLVFGK